MWPRDRVVARQINARGPVEGRHGLQGVLGDIDEHRAGASGRGKVEGLGDGTRNVISLGDQEAVLGNRHRDAADIGFLEGVGADEG